MYIFKAPGIITGQFNSFVIERIFHDAHGEKTFIDWSFDSRFILVGSRDNSAKVYGLKLLDNFRPYVLSGHSDAIVACSFENNSLDAIVVSRNGQLTRWECSAKAEDLFELEYVRDEKEEPVDKKQKGKNSDDEEDDIQEKNEIEKEGENITADRDKQGKIIVEDKERENFFYKKLVRHYLMDELKKENRNVKLTAASYHKKSKLLVTAYSTGAFCLHELPDVSMIHSLNISEYAVDTVSFNPTG